MEQTYKKGREENTNADEGSWQQDIGGNGLVARNADGFFLGAYVGKVENMKPSSEVLG